MKKLLKLNPEYLIGPGLMVALIGGFLLKIIFNLSIYLGNLTLITLSPAISSLSNPYFGLYFPFGKSVKI